MKRFSVFLLLILISSLVFSQESNLEQDETENSSSQDSTNTTESNPKKQKEPDIVLKDNVFITDFSLLFMLNTDEDTKSAPSPITYSLGFGGNFFQNNIVFGTARISIFSNYYLWDGVEGQPAEIENREVFAPSFMIDLLGGHKWIFGRNVVSFSGGLGVLARIGLIASGVEETDVGNADDNSTIKDDISNINKWFYSKANFLYPELDVSFSHNFKNLSDSIRFGVDFRTYFSLGSVLNGKFFDGMMFAISLELSF